MLEGQRGGRVDSTKLKEMTSVADHETRNHPIKSIRISSSLQNKVIDAYNDTTKSFSAIVRAILTEYVQNNGVD